MTRVIESSAGQVVKRPVHAVFQTPSSPLWRLFILEVAGLSCLWLLVYGGANWIAGLHHYRVKLWSEKELAIPFIPAAAIVYLSLFPMLWLSPFVLHTVHQLRAFGKIIALTIVISGIGFVAFPFEPAYPSQRTYGFVGVIFHFADVINLRYNMLPSLHVAMAAACAYVYGFGNGTAARVLWWTWAVAIAFSTLVTHQHHVIDVVVGGILGISLAMYLTKSANMIGDSWNSTLTAHGLQVREQIRATEN
jgi:membrane-associated phospholipid phosphatase